MTKDKEEDITMEENLNGEENNMQGQENVKEGEIPGAYSFVPEYKGGDVPKSNIADRFVQMWKSGNNFPSVFVQDDNDNPKLREAAERCIRLEQTNAQLQQKLTSSEGNLAKFNSELKKAALDKERLLNKMKTIWDYMQNVTESINYVTVTLDQCKEHKDRILSDYKEIIVKIYADNESLKVRVEQLINENRQNIETIERCTQKEHEVVQWQQQYEVAQVQLESYRKKIQNMAENEHMLQGKINELGIEYMEEKKKLTIAVSAEKDNCNRLRQSYDSEVQKLKKEMEEHREKFVKLEDERNDVFRALARKEEELEELKQSGQCYKLELQKMEALLNEKNLNYQSLHDEKIQLQTDIQEKDKQISQLSNDLEHYKLELSKLSINLTNIEELQQNVEQQMMKKQVEIQEAATEYMKKEDEWQKKIEQMKQNLLEKNRNLEQVKAQNDKYEKKMEEINSIKVSLEAELSRCNTIVQSLQKANDQLNHELSLMNSRKDTDMGDVQKLSSENYQLRLKIEQNTAEKAEMENKLKKLTNVEVQLNEKLGIFENNMKTAKKEIVDLKNNNQQLYLQNKEFEKNYKKLKAAEQKAEEFQKKYYDTDAHLNERIKQLQSELDSTKKQIQEASNQSYLIHQKSFEKNKKNLEASEKRAREFEEKYYVLLNGNNEKLNAVQVQLDEAEKRAQHFENQYKQMETQSLEFDKKIMDLEQSLKVSPMSSPTAVSKKTDISIRSVETLVSRVNVQPLTKSNPIFKTPTTPKVHSRKVSSSPILTPKSPFPARRKTPSLRSASNASKLEKKEEVRPRSASPDSSEMVIDDPFDANMKRIIGSLSDSESDQDSSEPKKIKKFFKNRSSQPK